jgi:hypothetical protein
MIGADMSFDACRVADLGIALGTLLIVLARPAVLRVIDEAGDSAAVPRDLWTVWWLGWWLVFGGAVLAFLADAMS